MVGCPASEQEASAAVRELTPAPSYTATVAFLRRLGVRAKGSPTVMLAAFFAWFALTLYQMFVVAWLLAH